MPNIPDLEAWAIFAKVVELRSFTAAAADLGLSKATVSKAVSRLEKSLGLALLHRSSRSLALTESGRSLAGRAQHLLSLGEEAEEAARSEATRPRGLIRLAAPMSFGISHVGPAIAEFLSAYPDISIDLNLSDDVVDLVGGGFDAGLRIGVLPDSALRARTLRPVRLHLLASRSFVEHWGAPQHPNDLMTVNCLCYAYLPNPESWRFTNRNGEEVAVRPSGSFRCNSTDAMVPALRAGLGVAIVPDFIVDPDLETEKGDRQLIPLLEDWLARPVSLHLVTPPSRQRPARVTALLDHLTAHFSHKSSV